MSDTTQDFEQFCVLAHPRLVAALAHQFGDAWLAEELAHDALIRAGDRWEHVASLSSPLGWTFRVGVNLGRSVFRRRSAERRAVARLGPATFHHDADGADAVAVREALQTLTPAQRQVLVLRFYLRLTVQETADAIGLRAGAVRSLTHRGIRRLREQFDLDPSPCEEHTDVT